MDALRIFTIGHSTHPIEEFIELLNINGVKGLLDVRSVPGSRHNPQFGQEALEESMPGAGIDYRRLKELGGLRYSKVDAMTINGEWRNKSFRSYADYMQTPEFAAGIDHLIELGTKHRVAIMCAEAVPWRCHRSLIGDALVVRGVEVLDIMSKTSSNPHKLTSFAKVEGTKVWYPPVEKAEEPGDDTTK